jgi:transcriptional regulator of met regulon
MLFTGCPSSGQNKENEMKEQTKSITIELVTILTNPELRRLVGNVLTINLPTNKVSKVRTVKVQAFQPPKPKKAK